MEMFTQNGNPVFVMRSVAELFLLPKENREMFLSDFGATYPIMQDFVQRTTVMNKILNLGKTNPGEIIVWVADENVPVLERVQLVMSENPNERGGVSYGTISAADIQTMKDGVESNPVAQALREMVQRGDDAKEVQGAEPRNPIEALLGALAGAASTEQRPRHPIEDILEMIADGEPCGHPDCEGCNPKTPEAETTGNAEQPTQH